MLDKTNDILTSLALFAELSTAQRKMVLASMKQRAITRGEVLVRQGDASSSLFIVLHGSFQAVRDDNPVPIAEIHAGELIGEIGFLGGTPRTATVTAIRDAAILELDGAAYARIAKESPAVVSAMLAAVARRLGATSARLPQTRSRSMERTVAIVHGGSEAIPPKFFDMLRVVLDDRGPIIVDVETVRRKFGTMRPDSEAISEWLNGMEQEGRTIVYLAEAGLSDWTMKCVRQADMVVMATRGDTPPSALTAVEQFVCDVHEPTARRLVRVHDRRVPTVSGTAAWLDRLPVFMHHQVSLEDDADFISLARFLTGDAIGFVAGGGGGLGAAHVGVFRAFDELGVKFDIFGGTSVGAAMLAGFAMLHDADRLDLGTHRIFVKSRSFKRPTWPRYALLDHKAFDAALMHEYGDTTLVEDCWRPFFAVATNLSTQQVELIRRGPVWKAVRASSAIPGILPPFYTDDGMMLVDGGMMDNAPLGPMRDLKVGPNLLVHFGKSGEQRFNVKYDALPGRGKLLASMLNPFAKLPRAPSATNVLWRSLLVHQRYNLPLEPHDVVLRPPSLPGASVIDFSNHTKVYNASHQWTLAQIAERRSSGDPALAAMLAAAQLSPGSTPAMPPEDVGATGTSTLAE